MPEDNLEEGLNAIPDTPQKIAKHLRLMAMGREPYKMLPFLSPWCRNILHAAADLIESRNGIQH